MAKTHFLKPTDFNVPGTGQYDYRPLVVFLEGDSISDLQDQFLAEVGAASQEPGQYAQLVDVDYQVVSMPGGMSYSCALHFNVATRI